MKSEAKIILQHNLNTTSLENLAQDIAKKWEYNVEFGAYENHSGQHEFVQYGTVQLNTKTITVTLYDTSKDRNSQHDFVVELGEEAKIIHNNIIEILTPWDEEYQSLLQRFQSNEMDEDAYYNKIFDECRKIGADKVYFFENDFTYKFPLNVESTFDLFIQNIKKTIPYFEVKLL